jgi:hypothetical protein
MPATPHRGVHTRRKSPRRQPRQSPAPKGRKKTAQDKVQDASPDKVLGKQEKRFRPRRDQHSNQNHTHSPNVTKVSLAPSKPASDNQRCNGAAKRIHDGSSQTEISKGRPVGAIGRTRSQRDQRTRRQNDPRGARQSRFRNRKDRYSSAASNSLIATSISLSNRRCSPPLSSRASRGTLR